MRVFRCLFLLSTICVGLFATGPITEAKNAQSIYAQYTAQADRLIDRMSLEEKIGQMTLADINLLQRDGGFDQISSLHLGGVLAVAMTALGPRLSAWQRVSRRLKSHQVKAGGENVDLLLGTDAVHGDQQVQGSVLFPHNIGLGATHDAGLVRRAGAWIKLIVREHGFNWAYAPTTAIAHDYRWGRTYESFSRDPRVVSDLTEAFVEGAQQNSANSIRGVLSTTKHWVGDGATRDGVDEGDAFYTNRAQFLADNATGYRSAIAAGTGSIMASYNSVNGIPAHFDRELMTNVLKRGRGALPGQVPFEGFIVTDFGGIERAAAKRGISFDNGIVTGINAGLDMVMLNHESVQLYRTIGSFQKRLTELVRERRIPMSRIDDAVRRILRVKFAMGLIDGEPREPRRPSGSAQRDATRAAAESLVLLKNDARTLPIKKKPQNVLLLGDKYDDIGSQSGGWTLSWQGRPGNAWWMRPFADPKARSIATALTRVFGNDSQGGAFYHRSPDADFIRDGIANGNFTASNTTAIAVVGELPYAEYTGDIDNGNSFYPGSCKFSYQPCTQPTTLDVTYDPETLASLQAVKQAGIKVTTVLLSGRPTIITHDASGVDSPNSPFNLSDAFIAAWLPGTTGGDAIVDAISGKYLFRSRRGANTSPFAWPRDMNQVRDSHDLNANPLFPIGFGLRTS